jgi:C1A family cysteine protease
MQKLLFTIGAAILLASAAMMMMNQTKTSHDDSASYLVKQWAEWKVKYGKNYDNEEQEMYRFRVWAANLRWIAENQGDTYTLGMNHFGDLTKEEFKATYLMNVPLPEYEADKEMVYDANVTLPTTVNWVQQGDTVQVLNQGQCGSCWAFSATESLDSAYAMTGVRPVPNYSEQQVVSCSSAYGNQGCNGGWPVNAYKYIQANPLCTYAQYPYTSGTTELTGACNSNNQANCKTTGGTLSTYAVIPTGNCGALQAAVAAQPVSVCVDASTWSYYQSGIFSNCGTQLDHCVLAVGYVQGSYWYVQNSWATTWGEQGFIQLAWGNTCGVCQQAQYPTAK